MTPDNNAERIARSFTDARRAGVALPEFPGRFPDSLAQAYAVQERAIALSDARIAGWKVGKISPPFDGVDRLAGPIFADHVVPASDGLAMPIFAQGFGAAEAEFLLRIGTAPDPTKHDYTLAEATALIDRVCVGIEIASSPFGGINDHGAGVTISDFGNNNGLVIGADVPDWRDIDVNAWPVELRIDGVTTGVATAATMLDGPFGAARFLFELMATRGIALSAGQWISTGAVSGVHPVEIGAKVSAIFDRRLQVECSISAQ